MKRIVVTVGEKIGKQHVGRLGRAETVSMRTPHGRGGTRNHVTATTSRNTA